VDHRTSARFVVLLSGGVGTLLLAVTAGQPRVAVIGAVLTLLVVLAAFLHRRPIVELSIDQPPRTVEGDHIDLVVTVESTEYVPWLEINIELPPDLVPVNDIRHAVISVPAGGQASVRFPVLANRWGVATPGRVEAVARDRFGLFSATTIMRPRTAVRVHPADGNRRSTVAPRRLRVRVGAHQSRRRGDGSDFAEVRPFRTGDSLRSLNWRVTARRGERWVTERHPDQAGDLVFLLDNFRDIGPDGNQLVQRVVRAGMSLIESNLDLHDRVGLLDVGLRVRWFRPNQGRLHKARLLDALLESQTEPGLTSPRMADLPLHELKAGSMVVVLTGLTDPQVSLLPIELKLRGLEVVVLECSADDHVDQPTDEAEDLAIRLWRMLRAKRRKQLVDHGVPIMTWSADQPLEVPVAALARLHSPSAVR
jgi:uncharacterized protein (DUF58 family)